jgi:hypothetical protein
VPTKPPPACADPLPALMSPAPDLGADEQRAVAHESRRRAGPRRPLDRAGLRAQAQRLHARAGLGACRAIGLLRPLPGLPLLGTRARVTGRPSAGRRGHRAPGRDAGHDGRGRADRPSAAPARPDLHERATGADPLEQLCGAGHGAVAVRSRRATARRLGHRTAGAGREPDQCGGAGASRVGIARVARDPARRAHEPADPGLRRGRGLEPRRAGRCPSCWPSRLASWPEPRWRWAC